MIDKPVTIVITTINHSRMNSNFTGTIQSLDWFCWENLNRKPMGFYHQIDRAFRLKFSHHPIL